MICWGQARLFFLLLVVSHSVEERDCSDESRCWSEYSPCTVTCRDINAKTEFARRWRIWECSECGNITQPKQLHQFTECGFKVPYCLWHEDVTRISTRTVTRVIALAIAAFLLAAPTIAICCRFGS